MTDRIPDTPCSEPPCEWQEGTMFPCTLHMREHHMREHQGLALLEMFRVPAELLEPPESITRANIEANQREWRR